MIAGNPVEVCFGIGVFGENVGAEFKDSRITVITTKGTRVRFLDEEMERHRLEPIAIIDSCVENPSFESCEEIYRQIDFSETTKILAVGGGSVIDAAKAVSFFKKGRSFSAIEEATKLQRGFDTFERIPIVAVPTTAGTGSEVTAWGTIWDVPNLAKYSISYDGLYPIRAYCDPSLTLSLPIDITINTGLDALSHSFESIWNVNATSESTSMALEAIELVLLNLKRLVDEPMNLELRSKLMLAALKAGLAFSQTKTSVAHALSYYLTMQMGIPHGQACSFSLPHVLKACRKGTSEKILSGSHLERLTKLLSDLSVSTQLKDFGVGPDEFDRFFKAGCESERMRNGLVDLSVLRRELEATTR